MIKVKQVQISEELFLDIFRYFHLEEPEEQLYRKIKLQLNEKLNKIVKRNLYTEYKTADTNEEKEPARQKYLDLIGMQDDFRY